MKKTLLSLLLLLAATAVSAQDETAELTQLKEFQPATIVLTTGKLLKVPMANIFLKNASLLYMSAGKTKQANMETVAAVDFGQRHFLNVNNKLAELLDTVGGNQLLDVCLIDLEAYKQQVRNANVITSLTLDENVGVTSVELLPGDEKMLPIIHRYYFRIGDKLTEVHERTLKRELNKEQRRQLAVQMALPDFSWTSVESLKRLLRAISTAR
mgnify:CR=1 FL=1